MIYLQQDPDMAEHEHIAAGEPKHAADHHVSEHAGHAHADVFTSTEIAHFQAEDYYAGRAVVLLMLGIFSTGVFIYSIVAYNVIF
jgi:hypothetical protein